MTRRAKLRAELAARLLPELRARGFTGPDAIAGNLLLHEFKCSGARGTYVLSVQLEKHGLPRFVLNLYVEPTEGLEVLLSRGGVVRQGRLQPKRGATTRAWFRADAAVWTRLFGHVEDRAAEAVGRCIALLSEVDAWWATQAASDHIAVLEHTLPGRRGVIAGRPRGDEADEAR